MSVRCLSPLFVLLMVVSIGAVSGATGLKCYLGDEVSFKPNPTLSSGSTITWKFWSAVGSVIRVIEFDHGESTHPHNPLFKESIAADKYTGELTLKHVKKDHSGLYYFEINGKEQEQKFTLQVMDQSSGVMAGICVSLLLLVMAAVVIYSHHKMRHQGVDAHEVKSVSVMEGHSVTLHTHFIDMQTEDVIVWRFGPEKTRIVTINLEANSFLEFADVLDGMFRDRLQVDSQTGSLNITDIKTQHSGLYQMIISGKQKTSYTFSVTVFARLPVPVISQNSSQCSTSSERSSVSKCVLLCSVMNVTHVSLSWYNESHVHSSISVSDLNIRLSLPLEVEYQDTNKYRCVINNTFTNHTQHLNITQLCQLNQCSDCGSCCHGPESMIRLVIAAVVGVATVAVLVYDLQI
ncbi:uncharacterized protein LOC130429953 [Triplophysa dalaica]|uniref:uncharacterized protein LOC130429953 n=1 Tax=Triplophysa dalaica TaxID=1582913 RepID=UPI0024DF5C0A|nr:uncharacterized protein LOC130429953 [Triplophysa dalaica]